jgi:orotate phosphoribosyltransferase
MNDRERLLNLLIQRSLKIGDFTLASGARSRFYIDARRTTMSAEGQYLTGRVCLDLLRTAGIQATHVGGLTMGADPVAYAIAHASWIADGVMDAFSVRKKAKEHGTGQRIEGGLPADAPVVVVEDSMTSGASALEAVHAVESHGNQIAAILTLVDREEGGRQRVEDAGYALLSVFTARELLAAVDQS